MLGVLLLVWCVVGCITAAGLYEEGQQGAGAALMVVSIIGPILVIATNL